MNDTKEELIKKKLKSKILISIVQTGVLIGLELALFLLQLPYLFFIWLPVVPLLSTCKRIIFFKKAEFCYGEVVEVTLHNHDGDVYRASEINFIDQHTKQTQVVSIAEHWGDFKEEDKDEIDAFYEQGKLRVGKKVPVFYKTANPAKHIVCIQDSEEE